MSLTGSASRGSGGIATVVRGLRLLLLTCALLYLAAYMFVAVGRFRYPYELEWMEGAMVDHIARVLEGKPLYVRPSLEFVPFIYTPFYFYVSSAAAMLVGVGFTPLRLVSILSSLVSFTAIYAIVRTESGDRFAGVVAAGAFAATYRAGGAWLDIGRVDSLAIALLLAGMFIIRFSDTRASRVASAALLTLAFLTKQSMLVPTLAVAGYVVLRRRPFALWFAGPLIVAGALAVWGLAAFEDGWPLYYTLRLPAQHTMAADELVGFWLDDLLGLVPLFSALAGYVLARQWIGENKDTLAFYGAFAAGMLTTSWLSRIHEGGFDNVLLPGFAALAILVGLSFASSAGRLGFSALPRGSAFQVSILLAAVIQMGTLAYNPMNQVPTRADRAAGDRVIELLARADGEVLVPSHGFMAAAAGKRAHAHWQAIHDVLAGSDEKLKADLIDNINAELHDDRFSLVLVDNLVALFPGVELEPHYQLKVPLFDSDTVFWPVTGARTRPQYAFVPR